VQTATYARTCKAASAIRRRSLNAGFGKILCVVEVGIVLQSLMVLLFAFMMMLFSRDWAKGMEKMPCCSK
jgi:hypothetical protein